MSRDYSALQYPVSYLLFEDPNLTFSMIKHFMSALAATGVENWETLKTCCRCEKRTESLIRKLRKRGIYEETITAFFENMAKARVVENLDKDCSQ